MKTNPHPTNKIKDMEEQVLNYTYKKGVCNVFPAHKMINNWLFSENEEEEAALAHYLAKVAQKNGLDADDMQHLFPAILRMLKSKSEWSGSTL